MKKNVLLRCCLVLIIISAFAIRYRGVTFGFPLIIHADEPKLLYGGINIIKTKDLNPHSFLYPSLYLYMQTGLYLATLKIGGLAETSQGITHTDVIRLCFWGRMLTIVLSVGTIYLTYLIGRRLFNKTTAIIAALFTSFSCLHVFNSYSITVDSPMAFWVTFAFFISVLSYLNGPKLRYYLLNGILVGLAVGTKYTAFLCVVPMIFVHLHHVSFSPRKMVDKKILLGLLVIPVAFIFTTPFSIIDYKTFVGFLKYQHEAYLGHYGAESDVVSYVPYFISLLNKYGIIPWIFTGLGILLLLLKDKRKAFLLISFPLSYYLFLGTHRVYFDRNMVTMIPFLALFGGYCVSAIIGYLKRDDIKAYLKKFRYLICVLIIILASFGIYQQAHKALTHVRIITLPNTRWVSMVWVEKNIPRGSKIVREEYTPPISGRNYRVKFAGFLGTSEQNFDGFDYIVASSGSYGRFITNEKKYPEQAQKYKEIFSKYKLIKEFSADNKEMSGPVIRIYKTR